MSFRILSITPIYVQHFYLFIRQLVHIFFPLDLAVFSPSCLVNPTAKLLEVLRVHLSNQQSIMLYSVFIVSIQSISRLYICVIVGSRYINPCPYIRALSIDSPEIQSVSYLHLIRLDCSLWIRI